MWDVQECCQSEGLGESGTDSTNLHQMSCDFFWDYRKVTQEKETFGIKALIKMYQIQQTTNSHPITFWFVKHVWLDDILLTHQPLKVSFQSAHDYSAWCLKHICSNEAKSIFITTISHIEWGINCLNIFKDHLSIVISLYGIGLLRKQFQRAPNLLFLATSTSSDWAWPILHVL